MNFSRGMLWAQGQIFLQAGWGPAVLALAAMAAASLWYMLAALAGAAIQAGVALWLGGRSEAVRAEVGQGLHGFNGALTGCAAVLACGPGVPAAVWIFAGSVACALIVWGAPKLAWPGSLPLLTGPFCLVNTIAVAVAIPFERGRGSVVPLGSPVHDLLTGAARGAHQVILGGSVVGGILVLVGMFAAGWRVGVWAVGGTLVGTLIGFMGIGEGPATSGLLGYSALLTAVALAVAFPAGGSRTARIGVPLVAAALTVPLWWFLKLVGIATYTWPFVLITWAVLVLRGHQRKAGDVPRDDR